MGTAAAAGVAIASTVISTAVAVDQAKSQKEYARYNANLARTAALDARRRGEAEIQRQRIRDKMLRGRQRASLAASGALVDQDSPLTLQEDMAMFQELDILTIRANAARAAWGLQGQASLFDLEASAANSAAAFAVAGGALGVGATSIDAFGPGSPQ